MIYFISFMIFGLIIGLIARAVMPGRDNMGLGMTLVLGVVGAFLGGWLGQAFGWYSTGEGAGFLMSLFGAIIALAIYNYASRRKSLA